MKLDSKYFDRVRIKPRGAGKRAAEQIKPCEWPECKNPGQHKAPRGRGTEGQYVWFCLTHVKQYNQAYNYFDGMPDGAVLDWQKDALTGHRPTWRLGENAWANSRASRASKPKSGGYRHNTGMNDPFGFMGEDGAASRGEPQRAVRNAERKALHAMGLDETATAEQVKTQYKALVKRLHPDANGGSRATEDKLKEVIESYDYLRSVGYC
jgi:curved DNA-binding protein CbpA